MERSKSALPLATGEPVWACGMMTGTSMDGLDMALLCTDGETIAHFGPVWAAPPWPQLSEDLGVAVRDIANIPTANLRNRATWSDTLRDLEHSVTLYHAWALSGFQSDEGLCSNRRGSQWDWIARHQHPTILGVHGQTVLHRPHEGFTLQLFDPDRFESRHVAAEVVSDFRSSDLKEQGEGAPLAPFFHHACARWASLREPVAFLNIGGVANVTWLEPAIADPAEACLAFDTGPGNALVNDWMAAKTGALMDRDGSAAAAGRVHRDRLSSNAVRAYLDRTPPKSLDRNDFAAALSGMDGLSVEDGAATLTALTIDCVADAVKHMPSAPARWLVCGGGRRNPTMMRGLQETLDAPVRPVEDIGLDGDFLEAQAFAYLAVRALRGLPTSAPRTTGCAKPTSGGSVSYPDRA